MQNNNKAAENCPVECRLVQVHCGRSKWYSE